MGAARGAQRAHNQHQGSPEWYTPPEILTRVAALLGPDYFDPCPARHGAPLAVNGLAVSWRGAVFCNPPYGASIVPWIRKALTEPTTELLLLVPAYTDTRWFAPLFDCSALCFVSGRVHFLRPSGMSARAPHPSVLVYRGRRVAQFADAFSDLGPIVCTRAPMRREQPPLFPTRKAAS